MILVKGSKGVHVTNWQQFLKQQGYELKVDGDFGTITMRCTEDFQRSHNLIADGRVGPNTFKVAEKFGLVPIEKDYVESISLELLRKIFPLTRPSQLERFVAPLNLYLPRYELTTKVRVAMFLGNVGIETDRLRTTVEYASGWAYDISRNRKKALSLGNDEVGDGPKYKGRGCLQTTGKYNYAKATENTIGIIGVDFVAEPHKLAEPDVAVWSACIYWSVQHNLNQYADELDFFSTAGAINRGSPKKKALHYAERAELYSRALELL